MHQGSILLLSGFYQADIPLLTEKAEELQLRLTGKQTDGEWACLQFTLPC
jgi:ribosomal protein L11 methyltransferase